MNITQANMTLPAREDAFSFSAIKPMLVRPRFLKESDLLLHVPFLFWLMDAVRPAKSTVIGTGDGVAYLAICQAIEEFSINGRCSGIAIRGNSENGGTPKPELGKFDNPAETLYEGMADLHEYGTPVEALADIQPGSLGLLLVDLGECSKDDMIDPSDGMEKLSPGGCLVVHGLGEADDTMLSLKRKTEAISGCMLLFLDFGAGLAVVLKDSTMTGAAREFLSLDGNGCYRKADSLLLRRLGQGLAAIARNGNIAKRLDEVQKECSVARERHGKAEDDLAALTEAYEERNRKIWEFQATSFDREKENGKHQEALSDSILALKTALEAIQKEKDSIFEVFSEKLRLEKESHYKETGILTKLLEEKGKAGQAETEMLRKQVKVLSDRNTALLTSTSWRITAPMRKMKTALTGK